MYAKLYKKLPQFFQNSQNFHAQQLWIRIPITSDPCQHLVFSVCSIFTILIGVWCYRIVLSIHISLENNDVKHFLYILICHSYILFDRHMKRYSSITLSQDHGILKIPLPGIYSSELKFKMGGTFTYDSVRSSTHPVLYDTGENYF